MIERLLKILLVKRPAGSRHERVLKKHIFRRYEHEEKHGNIIVTVKKPDGSLSDTLFSCHTDTVDSQGGIKKLAIDAELDTVFVDKQDSTVVAMDGFKKGKGNGKHKFEPGVQSPKWDNVCLGADDGAGWWLLMEMIDAGVPGTYVFHHSEECGGVGSSAMRDKETAWLKQFKRAVAFDRRGTTDVIDFQRGGRCCSPEFSKALCDALNAESQFGGYKTTNGSFTDTANYIRVIPECTNISVGYHQEHGSSEWLDMGYLKQLRDICLKLDWDALPTVRDPQQMAPQYGYGGYGWNGGYGGYDDFDFPARTNRRGSAGYGELSHKREKETFESMRNMKYAELRRFLLLYPNEAAEILFDYFMDLEHAETIQQGPLDIFQDDDDPTGGLPAELTGVGYADNKK